MLLFSDSCDAYRFEIGGGHWIFGADAEILHFLDKFAKTKSYFRRSSVFFPDKQLYIPYPIQNNLRFLIKPIINLALEEVSRKSTKPQLTMKDWLLGNFGETLCELFFFPFHKLYTANLYERIAPQDTFKSPVNIELVRQGASFKVSPVGYNVKFVYPISGLGKLIFGLANKCHIRYNKKASKIDVKNKMVYFKDGSSVNYKKLISTLPLNKLVAMADIKIDSAPDPYTSVLVLNIGAEKKGPCPNDHWLYIPKSKSGFHRVGFYSNVDPSFVPERYRSSNSRVGIYVEKAFKGGCKPRKEEIEKYSAAVLRELQSWGFIKKAEVIDPTWIDVAYTWSYPGSKWRQKALEILRNYGVSSIGRYGQWRFQGIADSIKDGLSCGAKVKVV